MKKISFLLTIACFVVTGCKKEIHTEQAGEELATTAAKKPNNPGFAENDMVMFWNEKTATVLGVGMPQPFRTRYWAIIQIAVHDALNNIKPKYERFVLHDREQHADPDAAVASAAYWAIKGLNRQGNFPIDAWLTESLNTIPEGASKDSGIVLGKKAADAIIANRSNDGFTQVIIVSALPANGTNPGEYRSTLTAINWVPTGNLSPVRNAPNWGIVMKPYIIESNAQFRPEAPYAVNSAQYTSDYNEVKTKGARTGGLRTPDEEKIALFWSDNRPSNLWNDMARKAIGNKKMDAWKTARLLALLHVCLAESINSALNANYHFYFWRPETAIRLGGNDDNTLTDGDANWLPFLTETPTSVTPPVPGYPNGAAAYGGTAAEILKLFFGTDETSVDLVSINSNPAVPASMQSMHYTSFSQAATESTLRNVYTGWDFRASSMVGEEMGRQIAAFVFTHAFREE